MRSFVSTFTQLVIVTKYRRRRITKPMLDRLREITAQRCNDWNGSLTEFNGEADHVHALISMPVALRQQPEDDKFSSLAARLSIPHRLGLPAQTNAVV